MSINIPEHIAKRWCVFLREKLFWLERLVDLELDLVHMAAATLSPSRYTVLSHSVVSDSLRPHGLYSRPGSSESMEILQARILEWVAMPSSRGSSQPKDQTQVSHVVGGFFTIWATREAQEYWSGWPIPSLGDLHDQGIKPGSPALQVDSLPAELPGNPSGILLGHSKEWNNAIFTL